jgi:hypothetical protein
VAKTNGINRQAHERVVLCRLDLVQNVNKLQSWITNPPRLWVRWSLESDAARGPQNGRDGHRYHGHHEADDPSLDIL